MKLLWLDRHRFFNGKLTASNQPIRNGGAKGFKKAIASLEEQGLGECLKVGTVWAFKAS